MLQRVKRSTTYSADALHVLFRGRLPGMAEGEVESDEEREAREELEYAGELMVAQVLSLVRTMILSMASKK